MGIFEKNFLEQLRISYPFSCIQANEFYQEVIKDKHHVHMNSTKWFTFTDFIKYLGRTGKCIVEETERGWYITLVKYDVKKVNQEQNRLEKEKVLQNLERRKLREFAEKTKLANAIESNENINMTQKNQEIDYYSNREKNIFSF